MEMCRSTGMGGLNAAACLRGSLPPGTLYALLLFGATPDPVIPSGAPGVDSPLEQDPGVSSESCRPVPDPGSVSPDPVIPSAVAGRGRMTGSGVALGIRQTPTGSQVGSQEGFPGQCQPGPGQTGRREGRRQADERGDDRIEWGRQDPVGIPGESCRPLRILSASGGPGPASQRASREAALVRFAEHVARMSETVPAMVPVRVALDDVQERAVPFLAAIETVLGEIARRRVRCNVLLLADDARLSTALLEKTGAAPSVLEHIMCAMPENVLRVVAVVTGAETYPLLAPTALTHPNACLVWTACCPPDGHAPAMGTGSPLDRSVLDRPFGGEWSGESRGWLAASETLVRDAEELRLGSVSTQLAQTRTAMLAWQQAVRAAGGLVLVCGTGQSVWFF